MATNDAAMGSYQRYKKDTSTFVTWLSQAAHACGYLLPTVPSNSRVQQDSEFPAAPARFGFPVREILVQAKLVAESAIPALLPPSVILKVAKRAIATRKQATARFSALMVESPTNDSHVFFTGVLEEALNVLLSR